MSIHRTEDTDPMPVTCPGCRTPLNPIQASERGCCFACYLKVVGDMQAKLNEHKWTELPEPKPFDITQCTNDQLISELESRFDVFLLGAEKVCTERRSECFYIARGRLTDVAIAHATLGHRIQGRDDRDYVGVGVEE